MELEEKSLDVTANKMGIILILNIIFNGPMFYLLLKSFNLLKFKGRVELPLSVFSNFLLYMILTLFLLKVTMKDIYNNNKEGEKKLGWRSGLH